MADNEILNAVDEETEVIAIDALKQVKLGRQGENDTQTVQIDCSAWATEMAGATYTIAARRPKETEIYSPTVSMSGNILTWQILATDTSVAGSGVAEVRATLGEKVKKSPLFKTIILDALMDDE